MNELSINKVRNRRTEVIVSALVTSAFALAVSVAMAQSSAEQTSGPKAEWPTTAPYDAAICAFDKALTKASREKTFRERLTKSCESAKDAVKEIGNINIPDDRIIIFYEAEAGPVKPLSQEVRKKAFKLLKAGSRSSEKIHVFVLPTWKDNDTAEYRYEQYFVGMYDAWIAHPPRCKVP
jgi:hypothetical protein